MAMVPPLLAQQLLAIAQRSHQHAQKHPAPQGFQQAQLPPTIPLAANTQQTPSVKSQYDQAQQQVSQAQQQEDTQLKQMASTPDFQPQQPKLAQENPWAMVGMALAALVSKSAAPGMLNQVATFQKQAEDQYQRDLDSMQLQGQIYDRNQANGIRKLQALQGIVADREKVRNDIIKNALSQDKIGLAWDEAMAKHQDFGKELELKWTHEGAWEKNNAQVLAQRAQHDRDFLIAAGMRDDTATKVAEIHANTAVANNRLTNKVNSLRALLTHATASQQMALRQQLAEAQTGQRAVAAFNSQINQLYQKMAQVGLSPAQLKMLQGQAQNLLGQRDAVEKRIQAGLGDNEYSLAPVSDGISADAQQVYQQLEQQASYDPTTGQYLQPQQAPSIVVAPSITVQGSKGGETTVKNQQPTQPQAQPGVSQGAGFKGYRHRADVIRAGKAHGWDEKKSIEEAQAFGYVVVP